MSPSALKPFGIKRVCTVWNISRAMMQRHKVLALHGATPKKKRGPKTCLADAQVLEEIKIVLRNSPFVGEALAGSLRANSDETLPYAPDTMCKQESQSWQKTQRIIPSNLAIKHYSFGFDKSPELPVAASTALSTIDMSSALMRPSRFKSAAIKSPMIQDSKK